MATNIYINNKNPVAADLYEDIIIESLKMMGQDVYYLPRDIVNEDQILGHDITSRFNSAYVIEMYIENVDGFDGEGDIFTKFGIEIRDQATFVCARKRWNQTINKWDNEISSVRPREGDLIWLPLSKSMFEIMHVEHESPFYQLENLPTFQMRCELFVFNDEDFDTGQADIDSIEKTGFEIELTLADSDGVYVIGETITQTLGNGAIMSAEVSDYNDSDNIVSVVHIGSDSDSFNMFTTGTITGSEASLVRTVTAVSDQFNWEGQDNETFKTEGIDFLDFSETNPFGHPDES